MNLLVYVVILLALVITIVGTVLSRRVQVRGLQAYRDMPRRVDEAMESNTAVHVSLGSSAVRDDSTLSAIAGAELLYHLAERASLADKPTVVTLSDPVTLSLAQDALRKAYMARGQAVKYHATLARWYPQGTHSLAFGAGAGLTTTDESASANVMIGRFGLELMLAAESSIRGDKSMIAQSDRVDGQAVAFAVSDTPLIGEELYAGAAYLDPTPLHVGGVVAQDVLRYALVLLVIGLAILSFLGAKF